MEADCDEADKSADDYTVLVKYIPKTLIPIGCNKKVKETEIDYDTEVEKYFNLVL